MSLINAILAAKKVAMESQGPEVIDGTKAVEKPKNDPQNATLDPKAGGKPTTDSPDVTDKPAGAKVDPNAPTTVDSPADAGADAGSTKGPGKGDPAHTTDSADIVSTEDAVEVPEEVVTEIDTAADVANDDLEAGLDDAEVESDALGEESEQIAETVEAKDSLDETVTAMESLLERGSVTKAELALVTGRARRALKRIDIDMIGYSAESAESEEGRLEALTMAHEDLKEKVDRIGSAIKSAVDQLKARASKFMRDNLTYYGRIEHRLEQAATALEALSGAEAKVQTLSLPRSIHRYTTDASGKSINMVSGAAKLAKVAHDFLEVYPAKAGAAAKQGKTAPISESLFTGLPGDLTVKIDNGVPKLTLAAASDREDRKGVQILKVEDLKKIVKSLQAAMQSFNKLDFSHYNAPAGVEENKEVERYLVAVSDATLDFAFYTLRASSAISSLVALEIKQYGIKAKA